jgi:hypothetical protein
MYAVQRKHCTDREIKEGKKDGVAGRSPPRYSFLEDLILFSLSRNSLPSRNSKVYHRFYKTRLLDTRIIVSQLNPVPITVAARSKAWNLFARSNAGIVGSNPTQGMDVCLCLFCVCICSGLSAAWSPVQGVLPTDLGLRNRSDTKRFADAPCSKLGATGKTERDRAHSIQCTSSHPATQRSLLIFQESTNTVAHW